MRSMNRRVVWWTVALMWVVAGVALVIWNWASTPPDSGGLSSPYDYTDHLQACIKAACVATIVVLGAKWMQARWHPERGIPVRQVTAGQDPTPADLAKLAELHASGALTDDEFAAAKAKVLS